jgi:hypothetical protein
LQLTLEHKDMLLEVGAAHQGSSIINGKTAGTNNKSTFLIEMFYAAGLRRNQFRRDFVCVKSSPLISIASSSGRITMPPTSGAEGHAKRPFSSLFAQTH